MIVIKRNGIGNPFDPQRIHNAVEKAFRATSFSSNEHNIDDIVDGIINEIKSHAKTIHIETIQNIVEQHLVQANLYPVAKAYILYREKHRELREQTGYVIEEMITAGELSVKKHNGTMEPFNLKKVERTFERASRGYEHEISIGLLIGELFRNIFDGITTHNLHDAMLLSTKAFIERGKAYNVLTKRLLLQKIYRDVIEKSYNNDIFTQRYKNTFIDNIMSGIQCELFSPKLQNFDLSRLSEALDIERDEELHFLGLQTLIERYFIRHEGNILETPQAFWMRVAMGLSIEEHNPTERAIEFYDTISRLYFVPSTPTLFHSGLTHPQMSSCYVSMVKDDLHHIFKVIADNAQLSKWSGGIGNDWTQIRATGALIKSTNVESQGVIPFLKIANDTTVAINRSGKRRGATCAYLETWHLDIESFLDLRRNTGDERRRTHDMNTSNWIPDLFMKRVLEEREWTLFSPNETPDLHETYGKQFEERYTYYEQEAQKGNIQKFKVVDAVKLWRKMLTRLYDTGHPWITFKDPCNIRSPQDHCGIIHNSNLCTEITLNNSETETAVCNLGSINIAKHTTPEGFNNQLLEKTIGTAIRILDNVIDINYYPTEEARTSNKKHRPIALGVMGFQDSLFIRKIPFESDKALTFTDTMMENISYWAIMASSKLAKERGIYESYEGSKWHRGIFPIDTLDLLEQERGVPIDIPRTHTLDWEPVRNHVKKHGMRNSNTMAIAPTATISNIAHCYPCIEPIYKNIYVKANMSGEFTVVNTYLLEDLKALGLWNETMLEQLKYYDGNISRIPNIPQHLKELYKESFDIDPIQMIKMTARRSKWIDQSQSHNVFVKGTSGPLLHKIYTYAWKMGLKTTYYLRSLGASQIEKSTLDAQKYGFTQKRVYHSIEQNGNSEAISKNKEAAQKNDNYEFLPPSVTAIASKNMCTLADGEDCEACQ